MGKLTIVIALAVTVAGCGAPELTKEMTEVRSVTDASGCRFIESSYLESRPQLIQEYVKRNVYNAGGDSYKIVNVSQDVAAGVQISQVNYEAYDCRS